VVSFPTVSGVVLEAPSPVFAGVVVTVEEQPDVATAKINTKLTRRYSIRTLLPLDIVILPISLCVFSGILFTEYQMVYLHLPSCEL
jgi:hypothetical protein